MSIYTIYLRHKKLTRKEKIMSYTGYKQLRKKHTRTGLIYMVKSYRTGKYAICTWIGKTGVAIGGIQNCGKLDYIIKKWNKIV